MVKNVHEYLRAVGFSKIKTKQELNQLLDFVEECYQSEKTTGKEGNKELSERRKSFAPGMGIILRGEYDEHGNYQREYYIPYMDGRRGKFYEEIIIERHAEKESYAGACDDLGIGVSIIFYLQNMIDYLNEKRLGNLKSGTINLKLAGLSKEGKVLLPIHKQMTEEENKESIFQRRRMIQAARAGDEDAIESLTMEDMDIYSMISQRVANEDLFSIITTYFMPYGVECDHYNVFGEILEFELVENGFTKEEIYKLTVESHDLIFDICINKEDMLGEPEVGRRFKGVVWLQGTVEY